MASDPQSPQPPWNEEAEQRVLGAMLLDNRVIDDVALALIPEDFFRAAHQIYFRAILDLWAKGKPIDTVILADDLERRQEYVLTGGDRYLAEVMDVTPHAAQAIEHAAIVRAKSVARQVIDHGQDAIDAARSGRLTADELLQAVEGRLFAIAEKQYTGATVEIGAVLESVLGQIQGRADGLVAGVSTGMADLDNELGGLQPGQLVILAGRTSMGKTALALSIASNACEAKTPTLFVSLEMGRMELAERLLVAHAQLDSHRIRSGALGADYTARLGASYQAIRNYPLDIDDTPTRSLMHILANARRLKRRKGLELLIVDYVQLIEPADGRASRQEQVAALSRGLKAIARDLHVPVLALSQLNRQPEAREDHMPRMSDLRESGAQEQDADSVLLVHRPEYYDPNDLPGIARIIIAKNRNGRTGTVELAFTKKCMRFDSLSRPAMPPDVPPLSAF